MTPTFYCEFYNDLERLDRAVASLRRVYPDAPLILVSDGSQRILEIPDGKFGDKTILVKSGRLFVPEAGFGFIQRRLDLWNRYFTTTHLICFDTDVLFHRKFICEFPVDQPIAFGKFWQRRDGKVGIRGGCYGLTRNAITFLTACFHPTELPEIQTYERPGYSEPTIWIDNTLTDLYIQCGIRKRLCPDFGVHVTQTPRGNYAVTHPHKDGDAD